MTQELTLDELTLLAELDPSVPVDCELLCAIRSALAKLPPKNSCSAYWAALNDAPLLPCPAELLDKCI